MNKLPKTVCEAWKTKKGAIIFTTVDKQGIPNSIYATCVSLFNDEKILVANNFFSKTFENIMSKSTGSILFLTEDDKSYQIKGELIYYTEGELFEDMKQWNPTRLPGHGVVAVDFTDVYAGAEKIF